MAHGPACWRSSASSIVATVPAGSAAAAASCSIRTLFHSCKGKTRLLIRPRRRSCRTAAFCAFSISLLSLDGEKLSYRTLDVEQIGSVYETVMGFTVETRPGPAIAIRAGKNDRTPVFVDVAALTAKKGTERAKFLKEEADRSSVTDRVGKPLAAAADRGRRRRSAPADR